MRWSGGNKHTLALKAPAEAIQGTDADRVGNGRCVFRREMVALDWLTTSRALGGASSLRVPESFSRNNAGRNSTRNFVHTGSRRNRRGHDSSIQDGDR